MLLVVLWVRSYRQVDNLALRVWGARALCFNSGLGQLAIELRPASVVTWPNNINWHFVSQPAAPIRARLEKMAVVPPTFRFSPLPAGSILYMRYWIPVFATGFLAAVLGIRRPLRFSLRTLLIVTMLIAVVLGAIVYAAR